MIEILYEDAHLLIAQKPVGVLSQPDAVSGPGEDMLSLLQQRDGARGEVYLLHRLDRGVGGLMIFAKSREAAGKLSGLIASGGLEKEYMAIVHGCPTPPAGQLEDHLYKDAARNKSVVVASSHRGAKRALLEYRLVDSRTDPTAGQLSLVRIRLHTGRTHQIRVQFSSRGMPLLGDGKYGARDHGTPIGLWSCRLRFVHPLLRGKVVDVERMPTAEPFHMFQA